MVDRDYFVRCNFTVAEDTARLEETIRQENIIVNNGRGISRQ